jgi:hypothetical protein
MNKDEIRKKFRMEDKVVGDVQFELEEVKKIQKNRIDNDIMTITVGCSEYFTLICC